MNATEYDRRVLDHLALYPEAKNASVVTAGKHRKLRFNYRDKPITMTLAISPSDPDAAIIKIGDINRLLGHPPSYIEKKRIPRRLEDMLPQTKESPMSLQPTGIYLGTVAHYGAGRLKFIVPEKLLTSEMISRRMEVSRLDGYGWELKPTAAFGRPHVHLVNNHHIFEAPRNQPDLTAGLEMFGRTPAEYMLEGDVILIHLKGERNAVKPRTRRTEPRTVIGETLHEQTERLTLGQTVFGKPVTEVEPISSTSITESDMRAALAAVRRIEVATPYRIARTKEGVVAFVAPRIE